MKETVMYGQKISPKYSSTNMQTQALKTNSIFSVSSFGVLNKKPEIKVNSKR